MWSGSQAGCQDRTSPVRVTSVQGTMSTEIRLRQMQQRSSLRRSQSRVLSSMLALLRGMIFLWLAEVAPIALKCPARRPADARREFDAARAFPISPGVLGPLITGLPEPAVCALHRASLIVMELDTWGWMSTALLAMTFRPPGSRSTSM